MLFNSIEFAFFFPIAVAAYFLTPHRARWVVLLAASYVFYGWWRVEYLGLILASTVVDYVAGIRMGRHDTQAGRRPWLIVSLVSNLGLLFAFKYLGFFAESADAIAAFVGVDGRLNVPALLLPVGISFYTFQTLAYSIDVYRGQQEPERHFGIFALYVSFWPQLVAGPIERSQQLLPQFREPHELDWDRLADGLKLMTWGLFKKVVIADRLALFVNAVYNDAEGAGAAAFVIATYLFAFQIYCDFSGYSDIAIGAARTMGFDLMENFRRPYFSKSIGEFWRRWHISLSTWFRDYLYIPLGGNRVARWRWYLNLFVVFLVSGLWHGAAWTFVIWGALHGLYLVVGAVTSPHRERVWANVSDAYALWQSSERPPVVGHVRRWVGVVVTFHLVLLAWVFFRANTVADTSVLFGSLFDPGRYTLRGLAVAGMDRFDQEYDFVVALVAIAVLLTVHLVERKESMRSFLSRRPSWVRYPAYAAIVTAIVVWGKFGSSEFIYFQF